jgi:hypothetical protein
MYYIISMPDAEVLELCSRCEADLDTTGYPKWCKKCRAKYRREYVSLRAQMQETRGFAAGVSAMRAAVEARFQHWPRAMFSGAEIASQVHVMPGPGDAVKS